MLVTSPTNRLYVIRLLAYRRSMLPVAALLNAAVRQLRLLLQRHLNRDRSLTPVIGILIITGPQRVSLTIYCRNIAWLNANFTRAEV